MIDILVECELAALPKRGLSGWRKHASGTQIIKRMNHTPESHRVHEKLTCYPIFIKCDFFLEIRDTFWMLLTLFN